MPQLLSGIVYIIIYNDDKNICLKECENSILLPTFFLNLDNSIYIVHRLLKFSIVILDIITEGTVSHIFYLGPSFYFM